MFHRYVRLGVYPLDWAGGGWMLPGRNRVNDVPDSATLHPGYACLRAWRQQILMTFTSIMFLVAPCIALLYGVFMHIYEWGESIAFGSPYWTSDKYAWLIVLVLYVVYVLVGANDVTAEMLRHHSGRLAPPSQWLIFQIIPTMTFLTAFFPHVLTNSLKKANRPFMRVIPVLLIGTWMIGMVYRFD